MRVRIAGERNVIEALDAELEWHEGTSVVKIVDAKDDTELAFGVAEAAAIVGIVANIGQLIDLVLKLKYKLGSVDKPKSTPLKISTVKGLITLDLHQEITADELKRILEPISCERG